MMVYPLGGSQEAGAERELGDTLRAQLQRARIYIASLKEQRDNARKQATFWYLSSLEDTRLLTKEEEALYEAYGDVPEAASDGWKPGQPVYQAACPKD